MTIRRMEASDVDRVLEVAESLEQAPRWAREVYETAIRPGSMPRRIGLVAEEATSGQVVGFAVASLVLPEAELETIGVARERQRRGVGLRLLEELCRILEELEVTKVTLEVRESNRAAQQLYQSSGFVQVSRRPGYYVDPKEDALIMSRASGGWTLPRAKQARSRPEI